MRQAERKTRGSGIFNNFVFWILKLNGRLVWKRSKGLWGVSFQAHYSGLTGTDGLSLQVDVDTLLLGLALLDCVLLDTVEELFSGSGVVDVLDADVHSLLDVSVADALVDYDTNGGFGDVVYNAGLSVEVLVWHTRKRKRFSKPGAVINYPPSFLDHCVFRLFYSSIPHPYHIVSGQRII